MYVFLCGFVEFLSGASQVACVASLIQIQVCTKLLQICHWCQKFACRDFGLLVETRVLSVLQQRAGGFFKGS